MTKKIFLSLALFSMSIMFVEAKKEKITPEQKGLATINIAKAKAHVEFLASHELKGREAGTEWGHIAGKHLVSVLKQMGATPLVEDSFVQPFKGYSLYYNKASGYTVVPEGIEEIKKGPYRMANMRNILAKIEGENPDEIVVVGAHYDHLGYDSMLEGDKIYNGADDNASGVQAVLQLLQAFIATGQQPKRTVIFAFWDGEEKGLCGSRYFVNNFADISKKTYYTNLQTRLSYYYIRLYKSFKRGSGKVIVSTDHFRIKSAESSCKLCRTVVKLMVSKTDNVVSRCIEHINLNITLQLSEV